MSEDIRNSWERRISEETVARILELIANIPNQRESPVKGDLEGRFDFWFDGGACNVISGWNEYHFDDGTVAEVATTPLLSISIRFAEGQSVQILQKRQNQN